ncbi:acetoin utilization protein AcuC [Dietzia sp.]|uniref:acetoin utilization protein AcuC n=1 Tax=Dietzia sp. TaxID=1871616 RepID=UPI002FD8CC31
MVEPLRDLRGSSVPAAVVWSTDLLRYEHSADHPMSPRRLALTMALATDLGLLEGVDVMEPGECSEQDLLRIHSLRYVDAVRSASTMSPGEHPNLSHGLGTADNPTFPQMHEISAMVAGSTLTAARQVAEGSARRALSVAGGMHHAQRNAAAGFCVYNDCAIAIHWLLEQGFSRIAYVDVDVHHGDGVQAAFYDDPRVMTVSLHQHPATLWPMTGWSSEAGDGDAAGTVVNVPLLPGTNDSLWLRAFDAVVPGALRAFEPEIIVLQAGCDSHKDDIMADLSLTVDGHVASYRAVRALADELCEGRLIGVGGGGYELMSVVPRSWTHLIATLLDADVDTATETPAEWRELVSGLTVPDRVPQSMGDGGDTEFARWQGGPGAADAVGDARVLARLDQSILDTRRAVYPALGLDPDDPRD